MNQTKMNPFSGPKKSQKKHKQTNFIEALKSIGSSTVKSAKDDLILGTAKDAADGLFSSKSSSSYPEQKSSSDFINQEQLSRKEQEVIENQKRHQRHKEMNLSPLFDRREEEIKAQIKALREELSSLAKELGKLGSSAQKAIDEEIQHPGTYHVNFFEKLKKFIINLRKQVSDSGNWLEISSQRKQSQKHYWGNVKKSGTKFMLSHDRAVATQTG